MNSASQDESLKPEAASEFHACGSGESLGGFQSLEMVFHGLLAFLNNYIATNDYGHFELFRFFSQEITLVSGLAAWVIQN